MASSYLDNETMPETAPIALLDLDGTVADLETAMHAGLRRMASPDETETAALDRAHPWVEERYRVLKRQPGFWRRLGLLEDGMRIYMRLVAVGFQVHVLTKGPSDPTSAWSEKVEWAQENLPLARTITVTQDKSTCYGKLLVDDWPEYVVSWLEWRPRGLVIMPARPYNASFRHPNVIRFEADPSRGDSEWRWRQLEAAIALCYLRPSGALPPGFTWAGVGAGEVAPP